MIDTIRIKKIHVLKSRAGVPDDGYRALLSAYPTPKGPALSCKDLSASQADDLIAVLRRIPQKPFESLGMRPGFATPGQLRKIAAIWGEVSYTQNGKWRLAALNMFLINHFYIQKGMAGVKSDQVGKIIRTLETMRQEKTEKEKNR